MTTARVLGWGIADATYKPNAFKAFKIKTHNTVGTRWHLDPGILIRSQSNKDEFESVDDILILNHPIWGPNNQCIGLGVTLRSLCGMDVVFNKSYDEYATAELLLKHHFGYVIVDAIQIRLSTVRPRRFRHARP